MSDRAFRRGLLLVTIVAAGLLGALGVFFWRALPPLMPASESVARAGRPYAGPPVLPSALRQPRLDGIRVALLNEPENVRVTAENAYADTQRRWRELLVDAGARIVEIAQAEVIIAAEARCLGPVHRRQVAAHLARGGGLLTTGAFGAYDGLCAPLRDTMLVQLVGARRGDVKAAPRKGNASHYAVILGETVLGADIPPGSRIELSPQDEIAFRNASREMFYSDYDRHPLNDGQNFFDAAVVRSTVGPGRVVAFGFSIRDFVDDWSRSVGGIMAANAVHWASGRPAYQLAPWPVGKQAAAVIAQDVEADYQNAQQALDALDKYELPGTAFIVGSLAEADPVTTARLVSEVEIGTHTQRHLPLDTLSLAEQTRELEHAKRVAERLAGKPVTGLRPPEERFNLATLQIWADLGGDYVFASNNTRTAAPEIIPLLPDSLILLGRVSEDDFEILSRDSIRDREKMSSLLTLQVGEILAYRGLYMFSYHSHMFSQAELLPVVQALAEKLKESPTIWTTTAGDVARWWRARAAIRLTPSADGARVLVTNAADAPFADGVLLIDGPTGKRHRIRLPVLQAGGSVEIDAQGRVVGDAPQRLVALRGAS